MKIYKARAIFYLGLIFILLGLMLIPAQNRMTVLGIETLFMFIFFGMSAWIVHGALLKNFPYQLRTLGVKTDRLWKIVTTLGLLLFVCGFFLEKDLLYKAGLFVFLAGMETHLLEREWRAHSEKK
ncbi:hypothetical protein [Janthinobacterium fluminis]|uniref:Uncharacterized protein n=1 Tax=Janthinobacterium fluminis TaxID=2987524 RepID=A0ABT5K6K1_9BURK|nr:hypothetical protein [Janthinobacterium fluminis]MDC8760636.1 hypothetical protein [Janthinobacterium fluminis]